MDDFLERVRSSISDLRQRRLGERAVAARFITPSQLEEALRENGSDLGERLVRRGWLTVTQVEGLRRNLDSPDTATGFARYELLDVLGEGAMSVVHRARDRQLGRIVAVKVLRDSLFGHPVVRERFARESQALARLDHPGVVKVFDAGGEGGQAYLVMELVPGEPLSKILERKALDRRGLLRLLEKVARGIHHAHEKGIIHRDLKPDNILVSGEQPKVADFGLAHLVESSPALTRSGAVLGTPMYMAPEQIEGGREVTARTDVHALGILLYEILTGRTPYSGTTLPEVYASIAQNEPEPLRRVDPTVPWELDAVALKAIEKDPSRRYASAEEFAEELRRHLAGEPVLARPVSGAIRLWRRAVKQRAVLIPVLIALVVALGWGLSVRRARVSEEARSEALVLLEAARPPLESARAGMYTNAVEPAAMLAAVDVAERTAVRALELAPELALAHYRRGEARELRGDYPGAQECFARAAELDPKFGPARYRLGRVLLWRAYGANIVIWIDEREARRVEAEQLVQQGIREIEAAQESGFDNELHREIASAMLAFLRNDKKMVHQICREGINRFGKKEGVEEFHWLLGLVLGTKAAQMKAFDEAISLRPKFALALYSRASVHDDFEARIQDVDRAIAVSPGFAEAYLNRGSWRFGVRDAKGAYDDFNHLIQMGVELAGAYNGRGRVLVELMNDPDRAIPDLNEAIRLRPEGFNLPYMARARAYLLKKDYDRSIADATKAISMMAWSEVFLIRGLAKLGKGDREGARADLQEALRRAGPDPAHRKEIEDALERAKQKP
ncbi:MAG TPA: protein kinase [Planctomycetota bacterium]|nr:protein kinase [Planctomycetota bacterium]